MGIENQQNPEAEDNFTKAVNRVTNLYYEYEQRPPFTGKNKEEKITEWKNTAEEYPNFKNKILGLIEGLQVAKETKEAYAEDQPRINEYKNQFSEVGGFRTRSILTSILWSRMSKDPQHIDPEL